MNAVARYGLTDESLLVQLQLRMDKSQGAQVPVPGVLWVRPALSGMPGMRWVRGRI